MLIGDLTKYEPAETAGNAMPENQLFENESAFSFLKLSRTQRLYGFIGWYILSGVHRVSSPAHVSKLACVSDLFYLSWEPLFSSLVKLSPSSVGISRYDALYRFLTSARSPLYAWDCRFPHRHRLLNRRMFSLHACTRLSNEP